MSDFNVQAPPAPVDIPGQPVDYAAWNAYLSYHRLKQDAELAARHEATNSLIVGANSARAQAEQALAVSQRAIATAADRPTTDAEVLCAFMTSYATAGLVGDALLTESRAALAAYKRASKPAIQAPL